MTITITDECMTSNLTQDQASKNPDGRWTIRGPLLAKFGNPPGGYSRNQAITAIILAEHLTTWGADHWCAEVQTWNTELLTPDPTPGQPPPCTTPNTTTEIVRCLYCGSNETFETLTTVDERHSEYAWECADCHGVWAQ